MTRQDRLTTLERLRPATTVDESWTTATREAALQRLLLAAADPAPPARVRTRRRRLLLTTALTAGLLASGAGVATASGLLPDSFTGPLSFWTKQTGGAVDVQTARRVAQAPGPDGMVLTVWTARSDGGTICVAPMFEPPGPLDRPAPADFRLAGGSCEKTSDRDRASGNGPFHSTGGSADDRGIHTMWAAAGGAARAELRLADGTTRPAALAEGQFFFWYLADERVDPPTLVGYDATGTVVAEHPLPDLDRIGR
ncbi:hypothetical protein [Phytohabitans suffuscus]